MPDPAPRDFPGERSLAVSPAIPPPAPADDAAHILVVDDDRRLRDLLSRFLKDHG